jgi:hypothetical protein
MEPNRRRARSFIEEDGEDQNNPTMVTENGGLEPYDPNMTFDEDDANEESDDFNESNEEEYFSRTRSRSRSIHENDDKVKILTETEILAQVAKSKDHPVERAKVEKTGPLQHREVAILQQVWCDHNGGLNFS